MRPGFWQTIGTWLSNGAGVDAATASRLGSSSSRSGPPPALSSPPSPRTVNADLLRSTDGPHRSLQRPAATVRAARLVDASCGPPTEELALAERLAAPVGHSFGGKEWIQFDNPYDVGMSRLLGYGACYDAMHAADRVVLLGTDFPYDGFLPQARTVQVDNDPGPAGLAYSAGPGRGRRRSGNHPRRPATAASRHRPLFP
jgi:hypothetical protein